LAYHLGDLTRRHRLFSHRPGQVDDDLLVSLLEQVKRHQITEAGILNAYLVVEVTGRTLRENRHSVLATPVIAQAGEVELDVLQAAGTIRRETVYRLPEHPEHQIFDGR